MSFGCWRCEKFSMFSSYVLYIFTRNYIFVLDCRYLVLMVLVLHCTSKINTTTSIVVQQKVGKLRYCCAVPFIFLCSNFERAVYEFWNHVLRNRVRMTGIQTTPKYNWICCMACALCTAYIHTQCVCNYTFRTILCTTITYFLCHFRYRMENPCRNYCSNPSWIKKQASKFLNCECQQMASHKQHYTESWVYEKLEWPWRKLTYQLET